MKLLKSTIASLLLFGTLVLLDYKIPGYGLEFGWVMGISWSIVHDRIFVK